jgi:hypothetical protein
MTRCSNSQCFKIVPDNSKFCSYCGERINSSSTSPIPSESRFDEISIENFEKITKVSDPIQEKTIRPRKQKSSLGSKFAVRMAHTKKSFPSARSSGWRPGQAARRRNIFVIVLVSALATFFIFQSQSNPASTIKSAAVKVLPGSEAYKVGYEAGRNFKSNVNYNDEFINQWGPEMRTMLDQLGQSSDNMTQDMVGDLAEAWWPLVALKVGIMENSVENVGDFRRGMIDGYFR